MWETLRHAATSMGRTPSSPSGRGTGALVLDPVRGPTDTADGDAGGPCAMDTGEDPGSDSGDAGRNNATATPVQQTQRRATMTESNLTS